MVILKKYWWIIGTIIIPISSAIINLYIDFYTMKATIESQKKEIISIDNELSSIYNKSQDQGVVNNEFDKRLQKIRYEFIIKLNKIESKIGKE